MLDVGCWVLGVGCWVFKCKIIKMKTKLFLLTISLLFCFGKAQTNRFIYELKYRNDTNSDYRNSFMVLDVNPKDVKFYDYDFIKVDSLNKRNNEFTSRHSTKTDQVLIRKRDSNENMWYRDFFDYFVIKTKDELQWKIMPETQVYNGYKLQKATTNFGGRQWNAWFSNEINIKEGPYKFRGLPGLIFLLEDSEQNFNYKLVSNKKLETTYPTADFVETHYGKEALPVSLEKFNKFLNETYQNPLRMFAPNFKEGGNMTLNKEKIESLEELNKKKVVLQNGIKQRYIYLEKDKAPKFD
jgi:GLPGLI family protein